MYSWCIYMATRRRPEKGRIIIAAIMRMLWRMGVMSRYQTNSPAIVESNQSRVPSREIGSAAAKTTATLNPKSGQWDISMPGSRANQSPGLLIRAECTRFRRNDLLTHD